MDDCYENSVILQDNFLKLLIYFRNINFLVRKFIRTTVQSILLIFEAVKKSKENNMYAELVILDNFFSLKYTLFGPSNDRGRSKKFCLVLYLIILQIGDLQYALMLFTES